MKGETCLKLEGLESIEALYDTGDKNKDDEEDILEYSGISLKVFQHF